MSSERLFPAATTIPTAIRNIEHAYQLGYSPSSKQVTILILDLMKIKGGARAAKQFMKPTTTPSLVD